MLIEKFKSWLENDFPTPIRVAPTSIDPETVKQAQEDVETARSLMRDQNLSRVQAGLDARQATYRRLRALQQTTAKLVAGNRYILDKGSVHEYQLLGTRLTFSERFRYRFKQVFAAVEGTLRHRTWLGIISALIGFFVTVPTLFHLLAGMPVDTVDALYFISGIATVIIATARSPDDKHFGRNCIGHAGRPYASLNFVLFFLAPTILLALLWAIIRSPFALALRWLRHYEEMPLYDYPGELSQDMQDVVYQLGATIKELTFSLEVLVRDDNRLDDSPFLICRYGSGPGDTLYLWHDLERG